jgi:hypothetical protein
MPRAPASRAKPALKTYSKTPKRSKKVENTSSPSPSPPSRSKKSQAKSESIRLEEEDAIPDLVPSATFNKDMVLQIIIAKMEGSRGCDWFELSKSLGWTIEGEKKGKKGKIGGAMSGNELRDTYYEVSHVSHASQL